MHGWPHPYSHTHLSRNYFSTKEQYLDFLNPKGKYQKIFIFFVRIFYACMHAPMPPMHAPPIGGMEPVFYVCPGVPSDLLNH